MKKLQTIAFLIAISLIMNSVLSCTDSKENKPNPKTKKEATVQSSDTKALKIAFIDMDSVSNNYDYQKDIKALLESKQNKAESTLKAKEKALQEKYKSFQAKATAFQQKASKIRSEAEQAALQPEANALKNEEASIAKLEQEYQTEQAKLTQDFQEQFAKYTKEFNDTIEVFLKEYGESNGYDLLLGKSSATGGVLYGKDTYDITTDVIEALNERYKTYKKK